MDIKKQLSVAGEGAKLVAKQAERMKVANVSLPGAYRKLGEEVFKAGILQDKLGDQFTKIQSSIEEQEKLNQAGPAAEGFAEKMKAAAISAKNMAVSKKIDYDRGGLFAELGRLAFESHKEEIKNNLSLAPVEAELAKLVALDAEIAELGSSGQGSFFNPRNVAIGLVAVAGLAVAFVGYRMVFGGKNEPVQTALLNNQNLQEEKGNESNPKSKSLSEKELNKQENNNYQNSGAVESSNLAQGRKNENTNNNNSLPQQSEKTKTLIAKLAKLNISHHYQDQSGSYAIVSLVFPDNFRGSDLDIINEIPTLKSVSLPRGIESYDQIKTDNQIVILILRGLSNLKDVAKTFPNLRHIELTNFQKPDRADRYKGDELIGESLNGVINLESINIQRSNQNHIESLKNLRKIKYAYLLNKLKSKLQTEELLSFNQFIKENEFIFICLGMSFTVEQRAEIYENLNSHNIFITEENDLSLNKIIENKKIQKVFYTESLKGIKGVSDNALTKIKESKDKFILVERSRNSGSSPALNPNQIQDDFVESLFGGKTYPSFYYSNQLQKNQNTTDRQKEIQQNKPSDNPPPEEKSNKNEVKTQRKPADLSATSQINKNGSWPPPNGFRAMTNTNGFIENKNVRYSTQDILNKGKMFRELGINKGWDIEKVFSDKCLGQPSSYMIHCVWAGLSEKDRESMISNPRITETFIQRQKMVTFSATWCSDDEKNDIFVTFKNGKFDSVESHFGK